ncbi:hypothetical protein Tco_0050694, partial [Tanacetum coccineum]
MVCADGLFAQEGRRQFHENQHALKQIWPLRRRKKKLQTVTLGRGCLALHHRHRTTTFAAPHRSLPSNSFTRTSANSWLTKTINADGGNNGFLQTANSVGSVK